MRVDAEITPDRASVTDGANEAKKLRRPRRVAVLLCHGMGQQVAFETIDDVVTSVAGLVSSAGHDPRVVVSQLAGNDGTFYPRAELSLPRNDGDSVVAHFFEAYWAPLTEGKVSLVETLSFLAEAGFKGLRYAHAEGVFNRWMFGGMQEFCIPAHAIFQLGTALAALISWTAAIAIYALSVVSGILYVLQVPWPSDQALATLFLISLASAVHGIAIALVGYTLAKASALLTGERHPPAGPLPQRSLAPSAGLRWANLVVLLLVYFELTWMSGRYAWHFRSWLLPLLLRNSGIWHSVGTLVSTLVVLLSGLLLLLLRRILIQFPGDVAAYIGAYKVSKFEEIRHAIQLVGRTAAHQIYSALDTEDSTKFRYDEVLIVGHSLGSVLAYDTLNDAINRDLHASGWAEGSQLDCYRVLDRTPLLLTFGSPLDKTAFIFRTQKVREHFEIREALSSTMQPMIADQSYRTRPAHWINLWSPYDWISGSLLYYDVPLSDTRSNEIRMARRVRNIEHHGPRDPARAHTSYWRTPLLPSVLYATLTREAPPGLGREGCFTEHEASALNELLLPCANA